MDPAHVADQMARRSGPSLRFLAIHRVPITGPAIAVYDIEPGAMKAAAGFEVSEWFEGDGDGPPAPTRTRVVWPLLPV